MAMIYNVPDDIPLGEMEGVIGSVSTPILKIIRITRKEGEDLVNKRKVKILFKSRVKPPYVEYDHARVPVCYYISFGQCFFNTASSQLRIVGAASKATKLPSVSHAPEL